VAPANISADTFSPAANNGQAKASPAARALRAGWLKKKAQIFAGKYHMPDAEDVDTVSHYDWYEATEFKVPFPGEKKVRPASDFKSAALIKADLDD